ncbi:hypothetical protein DM860_012404 [Cuscuta australis]|uniref:asparagine--tRNA ligase n=1 Tax=Cuscuta australis TaxID=267555 RepID=A0A328DTS3_9ASTE|nr:hypothetical protein DM860_012404 [Cuscuta australis]
MASSEPGAHMTPSTNKYSNRVILKTIFERSDGGVGFAGQRVVIGGWVKSSREMKEEAELSQNVGTKDARCMEVLRFPLLRSILKALRGEGDSRVHQKMDLDVPKPPRPALTLLQLSDGSSLHRLVVLVSSELASPSQILPTGTCILVEGTLQQPALQMKHVIELKADRILHLGTVEPNSYPLTKKQLRLEFLQNYPHLRARTSTVASVMRIHSAITRALHAFFQDNEFLFVQVPTITTTLTRGSSNKYLVNPILDIQEASNEAKAEFSKNFFPQQMYLTDSGRLHLEAQACALGNVYTYGPRFQAKKSLPEMLIVEAEMAFSKLEDAMNCADDLLKFICKWILENSTEDVKFLSKRTDKSIEDHLRLMTSCSPEKISYTEAVKLLNQATEKKPGNSMEWGVPLTDEHASYLVDKIYKKPVIIYDHPKNLKPFNVRLNDDEKTVAAFDIIFPKFGTLVSGSQSEERLNTLSSRIEEFGLSKQHYEWYLDLRRHGTVQHSGLSLMVDSLVLFATGLYDIKDVVPFCTTPI